MCVVFFNTSSGRFDCTADAAHGGTQFNGGGVHKRAKNSTGIKSFRNVTCLQGIAYIVDQEKNVGYLSSPKCIHMVVIQQDLGIIPSIEDWQRLELLTLFMLQHCRIKNDLLSNKVGAWISQKDFR